MASIFKKTVILLLLSISWGKLNAQVTLDLRLNPPFTPFISDYVRPERIEDIYISLFNAENKEQRLKFRFSIKNAGKGIEIAIKESVIPKQPLVLNSNEFRLLQLEDVSDLYGKLNITSFDIRGTELQNLILDGTIPDGMYEVCVQAFDFDAPGFSKPLSPSSPSGCFNFQINYTDPPTDIRFENTLLQYAYGGAVPQIGSNSQLSQNYQIQFTPPALNFGSQYEYKLYVFDQSSVNPTAQRESDIINAIGTITPLMTQTSSVPFFTITPGDIELDFNKNYFLLIEAVDENKQTLFKNKGFSTMKAFKLTDIQPIQLKAPVFKNIKPEETKSTVADFESIIWEQEIPIEFKGKPLNAKLETRLKIIRISKNAVVPENIFSSNIGEVMIDTTARYPDNLALMTNFAFGNRFGNNEANNGNKWVIAVQNRTIPGAPLSSHITFENNGLVTAEISFNTHRQTEYLAPVLSFEYPLNNDTLPFLYPPVVIKTENRQSSEKIAFSQFNSSLELLTSNKYLKLTTDEEINRELEGLSFDTLLSTITRELNLASEFRNMGREQEANTHLERARALIQSYSNEASVQIVDAKGTKTIPLGSGSNGKLAILNNILNFNANSSRALSPSEIDYPNIGNIIYLQPFRNNIVWTGKVGIYSDNLLRNHNIGLEEFENSFRNNTFSSSDTLSDMMRRAFKTASGTFNVGMRTPELQVHYFGQRLNPGMVRFSFLPSPEPQKLAPDAESNPAWKEFELQHVAQQWNLEIATDREFRHLDTVVSKKINRQYNLRTDKSKIISDLYTSVNLSLNIQDTGKYYWRVTWSNPVPGDSASAAEKSYYRMLGNLMATSNLIGQELDLEMGYDSLFLVRRNYKYSHTDSFVISGKPIQSGPVKAPAFELIYPLPGDTIPFYYPPVVIKNNQSDSAYKFVLSKFNSNLEPFVNHNYFLLDSVHAASVQLKNLSYDSIIKELNKKFDALSQEQLFGVDQSDVRFEALMAQFREPNEKKTHLSYFTTPASPLLVLGNSATGKLNLHNLIAQRNRSDVAMQGNNAQIEQSNFGQLIYAKPYKDLSWDAKFAYYTPHGAPSMSVDTFEGLFTENNLDYSSPLSDANKQGLGFMSGQFSVGMKTPQIVRKLNGGVVGKNQIDIQFRPSSPPQKLFPETDNNQAWDNWKDVFVAQQWNIEVSRTPSFDSLVSVKSKCIVQRYSIPGSREAIMNDFYNVRNERLNLDTTGKFYYRITWSNPVEIDTNNTLHRSFLTMQQALFFAHEAFDDQDSMTLNRDDLAEFIMGKRVNYRISETDSFQVVDSSAVPRDTADCGLNCRFAMGSVPMQAASGHIAVNDEVDVGLFKMKIKTLEINRTNHTHTGTGTINCALLPAPISVSFKDIKFNQNRRFTEGEIKAEYKSDDIATGLMGAVPSDSGMFAGILKVIGKNAESEINAAGNFISNEQIPAIYDYFNSPACLVANQLLGEPVTMPFGLSKEVDNFPYTIAITDIIFKPAEAKFNAAAILPVFLDSMDQYFGFGAMDICLTPGGLGSFENGGALELIGEVALKVSDYQKLKIIGRKPTTEGNPSTPGTRLVWDCKGFKHIDLKASLEIDTNLMVRVHGKTTDTMPVVATGHAVISSWNNFLLTLDFDTTFKFKSFPELTFKSRRATLDNSDLANAEGMTFPTNYVGERSNAWRGLYFQEIGVRLPDIFNEKDTVNGLAFSARNIIIDFGGVTANLGVDNLLSLEDGSMAGWRFSIDRFGIDIVNNVPRSASFTGQMGVPILQGNIGYSLLMGMGGPGDSINTRFTITPSGAITMPGWFASVNLLPTSTVELIGDIRNPQSLTLQSNFNGDIAIGQGDIAGFKDVNFGSLPFEGLKVSTGFTNLSSFRLTLDKLGGVDMNRVVSENRAPSGGGSNSSSSGTQKTGGFPIMIQDFGPDTFTGKCLFDQNPEFGLRIGVKFKVVVNVAELGPVSIGGQCNVGLYAAPVKSDDLWSFIPSGINLDTILINAQICGALSIKGGIAFISNDPVYGNGVAGFLEGGVADMFKVGMSGMFGEVRGMRYWMFGASLSITPGIPIDFSANVVYANYFSGEVWNKMTRTPGTAADAAAGFRIGRSPSGASFVPNENVSFGLGAALGLTGPPGSPLFGDVGLYAEFTNSGGLSRLTIEGNMWMTQQDKAKAQVFINGVITIDVSNEKFMGSLTAMVDVAAGMVKGRIDTTVAGKTYYIAGNVDLLIDFNANNWHIKLGNPFIRNGKLGVGFYAGTELVFNAGGYFMMGNNLPQSLPPMDPTLVTKLQQAGITLPAQRTNDNKGFAIFFGMDANIPEKKIELGVFYAGLSVSFAIDGMLNQGAMNCGTRNGIDGWYMTGRAYAVVNGAAGMHVETPFYNGDIIVAELNAGMVLDAGLPNPYYFKGQFSANYSILGGLIEGSKRFDFELAEDENCKPDIRGSKVSFGTIVADVKPSKDQTDVLVGAEPTFALNFGLDKETEFTVPETVRVNGINVTRGVKRKIRVRREFVTLKEKISGANVTFRTQVSGDGLFLYIRPDSFLKAANTRYELSAKFVMEQFNTSTNQWSVIKRSNNKNWDTTVTILFITEKEASVQPDYISYSTPRSGENYFKKGSTTTGQIVFKQNNIQNTFFTGTLPASGPFRQTALASGYNVYYGMFASAGSSTDTVRVALSFNNNIIQFPIPSTLSTGKIYQFRIIKERIPGTQIHSSAIGNINIGSGISMRKITVGEQGDRRMIVYAFVFKVSKFNTLQDKINQLTLPNSTFTFTTSLPLQIPLQSSEPFEMYEIADFDYPVPTGTFRMVAPMKTSCSNVESERNNWLKTFYFHSIYKAGDTLQRKFPAMDGPYLNHSAFTAGSNIYRDANIKDPFSTVLFSYDLRLADSRLNQISNDEIRFFNPISSATSSTQSGYTLNIEYSYILFLNSDFQRLKSLANAIYNRPLSNSKHTWKTGLTTKEQELITKVRSSNFSFYMPFTTDKFYVGLHAGTGSSPVKKISFNNSRIDLTKIATTTTVRSSMARF